MQFILTQNKTTVHLGPVTWNSRFIQSTIDDLEIEFTVPSAEQGYVKINDEYEIFPVVATVTPDHNAEFEQLVGPTYTYTADEATSTYATTAIPLEQIKNKMKQLAAADRYKKEIAGTTTTVQGNEIVLYTDRTDRNMYVQKYLFMAENATTSWKVTSGWIDITKPELGGMIAVGAGYIQAQYDAERVIVDQIEAATTAAELKAIVIVAPKAGMTGNLGG